MLDGGWPAEVERLLGMGFRATAPGLVSLGYRQVVALLQGRLSRAEALDQVRRCTRQYAKRQITWFRRDRRLRWLDLDVHGVSGAHDRILRQWERWAPSPARAEAGR
jgi:tRNA dimethylallyltransferase